MRAQVRPLSLLGLPIRNWGLMREMSYALAAGLGLLPTLVSVLVLVVVESDALHHAKKGTYPKWAHRRFLAEVS